MKMLRLSEGQDLMREMERICDHRVISTVKGAEPIGPQKLLDLTGATLPGRESAQITVRPSLPAAPRSTPPGLEARSRMRQSSFTSSSQRGRPTV